METIWPIVAAVIPVLIGWASLMICLREPDAYQMARILFWVAAISLGCTDFAWQLTTDKPAWFRVTAGVFVSLALFVVFPMLLRWVRNRERSDGASSGTRA
jgi:hypothetical protein